MDMSQKNHFSGMKFEASQGISAPDPKLPLCLLLEVFRPAGVIPCWHKEFLRAPCVSVGFGATSTKSKPHSDGH